ncbi:MAG: hypothetical protein JOS17DRAFT_754163 [Linnemannia elongata]|nr:MAG: hypothetical protein JOS17DRAFT_754163 [Linnemannia elongata]
MRSEIISSLSNRLIKSFTYIRDAFSLHCSLCSGVLSHLHFFLFVFFLCVPSSLFPSFPHPYPFLLFTSSCILINSFHPFLSFTQYTTPTTIHLIPSPSPFSTLDLTSHTFTHTLFNPFATRTSHLPFATPHTAIQHSRYPVPSTTNKMSRSSPLVAPIIDEDFDLCISETNLPFPYSDHCSTGPPSLYEFDVAENYDEEDEEGGYFDGGLDEEEEEEEEGDVDEDDTLVETKEVLLEGDSDSDPALTFELHANGDTPKPDKGAPSSSRSRNAKQKQLNDLSDQLHFRLENIHNNNNKNKDTLQTPTASTPKTRPYYSRQSYSFDSNEGWHEEYEEDDAQKDEAQDSQTGLTGIIQTVTSSATSVAYAVGKHWSKKIYESLLASRDPKAYYTHLLSAATNYEQWAEAAAVLDRLQGKDKWKNDPRSPHYDYEMLQERLSQLSAARESGDLGLMIYLLRTSLSRNLGNVGRPQLYANTIIGTKRLIEEYNAEVIRQLNIICDTESDDFSMAAKLEFFTHTRQAFGRTALLLSGGATMGLMHIGVIKTLYYNQLLPRIISGSSCGSIIAGILCTRTDEEISEMFQFDKFNFTVFHTVEEKGDVLARLIHFLKNGALFDAQVLKAALKDNIGNVTFQEAYNRTRRILNITVSTSATFEMPRLLNYLTAPNVLIWSAVATSSAAPFIYNSAPLMAKDKNGDEVQWNPSRYHWIDGSVDNDLPMNKLSELFNVNHFIVCQVNPYIVPFLHNSLARSPTNRFLGWILYQARSEVQHRMNQLSILGVMPGLIQKVQAIMAQRYYGDITIVPDLGVDDYMNIVTNPTVEFLVNATLKGERATWPKISIIKNHCSIEHCLDDILYRLRLRRLEAYRPPATASKQTAGNCAFSQAPPPMPTTSSSATATMRSSASACFGTIGRSNSSPATPNAAVNLDRPAMTPMAPMPVNSSNRSASGLTPSTVSDDAPILGVETREKQPTGPQAKRRLSMEVPIPTATVQSKTGTRSGLSAQSHAPPPPLRRANSSSAPSHNAVRTSSNGAAAGSAGGNSTRHRNSISNVSEYSFQDNGEVAVKTSSFTAQRTASSSSTTANMPSPRIVFTPSMTAQSPMNEADTQFSQFSGLGLGQSATSSSSSSSVVSPTLLSTATMEAVNNPVPAMVQTHKSRASSKKSSSSSSASSTTSTTSTARSGTSRSRSKQARTFQMTSLEN